MCDTIHEYHGILAHYTEELGIKHKDIIAEPAWTLKMLLAHFGKRFCTFEEFDSFLESYVAMKKRVAKRK